MAQPTAVDEYKKQLNAVLDGVDAKLEQYPIVQQITAQTKVRPSYMAVGLVAFLVAFVFYGFGGRLVSNLVGFSYPLYESFGSLKRKEKPGEVDEEDSQWLTYWVVYSTFTLLESFSDFLQVWIPLYHLVKIVFLLWCMLPQTHGALMLYRTVIEPILVRYEGNIDGAHHRASNSISQVARDVYSAGGAAADVKKKQLVDAAINNMVGKGSQSQAAPGGAAAPGEHEEGEELQKEL